MLSVECESERAIGPELAEPLVDQLRLILINSVGEWLAVPNPV